MPLTPQELQTRIDTLLSPLDPPVSVWGQPTPAAPIVMAYQFETAQPPDLSANFGGWTALTNDEKAAAKSMMAEFAEVINVRFVENGVDVPPLPEPDINLGKVSFGPGQGGQGGYNYSYSTDGEGNVTSKTWDSYAVFNNTINLAETAQRNLLLHEFGHAMGLKHPGNYDIGGSFPPPPFLPADEDNNRHSIMSYNADPTDNAFHLHLMLYDIAALQYRWGANYNTRAGNDVYTGPRSGSLDVIWDGGGADAIDATARTASVTIDLTAGHFSSLGPGARLAIAYGARIENAIGGSGSDLLIGNELANYLNGRAGNDTMNGGAGNDSYIVNSTSDVTSEAGGSGIDTVYSAVTRTLGADIEKLTLIGAAHITGTGNADNNVIIGNSGNNSLNGSTGNDTMMGGAGNDAYVVNSVMDVTSEVGGSGTDTVLSAVNRALGTGLEHLTLLGSAVLAIGNGLGNRLIGNASANTLKGEAGIDTMTGGGGNDIYYVDNASDVTSETGGSGTDLVISSVNRALGAGLENLTLIGTASVGIGNELRNAVTGHAGANVLFGMAGIDTMNGGGGADRFVFSTTPHASNVDFILGFSATDDFITLDSLIFTNIGATLDADEFVAAAAAQDAEDRIIYNQGIAPGVGALLFDADGAGGADAIRFALLAGQPSISHQDFQIF